MVRRCLIIDNEDQSETIDKIHRLSKAKGLQIECEQFNVGATEFTEFQTKGREIDVNKVIFEYRKRFKGVTFHLAVFDWNLDDPNIDGIELIRQLTHNKVLHRTPKIVISAKLKIILDEIVEAEKPKRIEKLSLLVNSDIRDYKDRDDYEYDIIDFFKKNDASLDLVLEEILMSLPDLTLGHNFGNKNFEGKTFGEIAKLIDDDTKSRLRFKEDLIQQVIAYLTEKI